MEKRTRRLIGGIVLAVGAIGAAGTFLKKKNMATRRNRRKWGGDVWARPGMQVIFRAELMPGREREERTFRVKELLPSGRVLLQGVDGEHAAREFEQLR